MASSLVGARPPRKRVARLHGLLAQVGAEMQEASQLVMAMIRVSYCFFTVACLTAAAVVIINGRRHEGFVWGSSGIALALGWAAAKLAKRGVARVRRVLREEWNRSWAEVDHSRSGGPRPPA